MIVVASWTLQLVAVLSIAATGVQIGVGLSGTKYNVTVVTDPSSGPFTYRSALNLSCIVDPLPPDPVTYQWNYLTGDFGGMSASGQNFTHSGYSRGLRFGWFFCHVLSNKELIGIGMKLVEFQRNRNNYIVDPHEQLQVLEIGRNISLRVNNDSFGGSASLYSKTLFWYHNNTEVHPSGRISILSGHNGTELHIRDAVEDDAGIYQVKATTTYKANSHYIYQNNRYVRYYNDSPEICDSIFLPPLVEYHYLYAPVTFMVTSSSQGVTLQYNPILALPRDIIYLCLNNDQIVIQDQIFPNFNENLSLILSEIVTHSFTAWYLNGQRIIVDGKNYISSLVADEESVNLKLLINNPTGDNVGVYVGYVHVDYWHILRRYGCDDVPYPYDYYFLGLFTMAVASVSDSQHSNVFGRDTMICPDVAKPTSTIVGAVFGTVLGVLLVGLLLSSIAMAVYIKKWLQKTHKGTQEIDKPPGHTEVLREIEVQLNLNKAYETEVVPDQPCQASHDDKIIEEHIYEHGDESLSHIVV